MINCNCAVCKTHDTDIYKIFVDIITNGFTVAERVKLGENRNVQGK